MNIKLLVVALVAAGFASIASARLPTVYNSAKFVPVGEGGVGMDGFGRGATNRFGGQTAESSSFLSLSSRVNFFDTWNIGVSGGIKPGIYSFKDMKIEATGSLLFGTDGFSVTFNSYDEAGELERVLFNVIDGGKQAVGSGIFTVLSKCPIKSCVWIDLTGTQVAGESAGYGDNGTFSAAVVPEPATYGMLALGLAVVGAAARRRRAA